MRTIKKLGYFFSELPFALFVVGIIMVFVTEVELKMTKIPRMYSDGIWFGNIILAFLVYFASIWLYKGGKAKEKEDEDVQTTERILRENEELFRKIKESLSGEEAFLATKSLVDIAKGVIPERKMLLQLDKVFGKEAVDEFFGRSESL